MGSLAGIPAVLSPFIPQLGIPGALLGFTERMLSSNAAYREMELQQGEALKQLQERQRNEETMTLQNAELEKQRIAADSQASEARRMAALRRAVARQKTLFSAQGLGSSGAGSNEAVLLGLYNDSDTEGEEQTKISNLRNTALDQNLAQQKQKNLLELSQMAERQNLQRYLYRY